MLETSSSKGSPRKRSSSERKEVGRPWSSPSRELRRGHEGKAQEASCECKFRDLMSTGAADSVELIELYDPYDPHMMMVCG